MNFLFVNLNWQGLISKKYFRAHLQVPPLDLILLRNKAAQQGHRAHILDTFIEDCSDLDGYITWADWIIVTTTPFHMWQCPNPDWDLIKKMLIRFPREKTVLIGLHGSVFPETTLRETGMSFLILREPETTFCQFLSRRRWQDCEGTACLTDGSVVITPPPLLCDMNELVVTDYCVDISKYSYFLLGKKTGLFEASRGCPWKCTFCNQEMFGWEYRRKAPAVFAEEVSRAVAQTGMETAYFF